jgi:hypothetical protein
MLVCVKSNSKLIGASNEPTPAAYIEFEEMMMGLLNEPCSGGGAQLLDAIELGSNINFPSFVTFWLLNNVFTLKFADIFNGTMKLTNNFVGTPKNFVMHTMHPKELLPQNTSSKHCTMHKQFV